MNNYGLTRQQLVARVATEILVLCPWLPPYQAACYAHQFVENGART